jgi:hypothetical protein
MKQKCYMLCMWTVPWLLQLKLGPTSCYFSYFMKYCPSDVDSLLSISEISGFHGTSGFTVVFRKPETKSYFYSQEYSPLPETLIQRFILMKPPHLLRASHVEFSTQVPLQQFLYISPNKTSWRIQIMKFSPPSFHLFSYVQILCSAPCHQAFSIIFELYLIKLDQISL